MFKFPTSLNAIIILLSACGPSTSDLTGMPPDGGLSANDSGTVGNVLGYGGELRTLPNMTAGFVTNDSSSSYQTTDNFDVRIKIDGNGIPTLTVEGHEHIFTANDLDTAGGSLGYDNNADHAVYVWSGGTVDQALSASNPNYAQILHFFSDDGSDIVSQGFAILGNHSEWEDLKKMENAVFWGRAHLVITPLSGVGDWATSTHVKFDAALSAEFDEGTIAGDLDNLRISNDALSTWTEALGAIHMSATGITHWAPFGGGVLFFNENAIASLGLDPGTTGTFSGALFGPNGEDIGGAISFTDSNSYGYGFFLADKH